MAKTVPEQTASRIGVTLLLWFTLWALGAVLLGSSLTEREAQRDEISGARLADYRRQAAEKLEELHEIDRERAASRKEGGPCTRPWSRDEAARVLARHTGRAPSSAGISRFSDAATKVGLCDPTSVDAVLEDAASGAAVDALFILLLERRAGVVEQVTHAQLFRRGWGADGVARAIRLSTAFKNSGAPLRPIGDKTRRDRDLKDVAALTPARRTCEAPLGRREVASVLAAEFLSPLPPDEVERLAAKGVELGLCDAREIRRIYRNRADQAAIDTLYRFLLRRLPDPMGRLVYGTWLAGGLGIDVVARDILESPEFKSLLAEPGA